MFGVRLELLHVLAAKPRSAREGVGLARRAADKHPISLSAQRLANPSVDLLGRGDAELCTTSFLSGVLRSDLDVRM
ncbi:hypothetical protein D3C87_1715570 [compost metagenome]